MFGARTWACRKTTAGLLELADGCATRQRRARILALDDKIFTIKLTPNRADCLSVLGVAREVAALTGAPLNAPDIRAVADNERRRISGEDFRCRMVRPLYRAGDPQRQREGDHAGLDEAAAGARGAALDFGTGGCFQLRDAGTGPSAACIRPRQARRRHRRALRTQGREAQAAERAGRGARRKRAGDHRCRAVRSGWRASWAATAPRPISIPATSSWKRRFCSRRRSPDGRAATTSRAMLAPFRARRRFRQQHRRHRARHRD